MIFSEKTNGDNYYFDAWRAVSFNGNGYVIDLGIKDRYFTEDGSTKVSPSGRYLILNSISGGYISDEGEEKEYVDKAHCSIVDMKNGCYVSDWEGDVCGYDWKKMKMYWKTHKEQTPLISCHFDQQLKMLKTIWHHLIN